MTEKEKLIKNLIEKSGKDEDQINRLIGDKVNELSGLVSEEGAIYIVANELGVRLDSEKPKKESNYLKIKEITEAKVPVSIIVKVIKKYDKINFTSSKGSQGSVQSILAGDETGVIRITFWNDQTEVLENIHELDILKISNAYTRENSQNTERIDVHYTQYSDLEVNPEGIEVVTPEFKPNFEAIEKNITDLEQGDRNVQISATITDFDIPRFYIACPDCFKKVFQEDNVHSCAEHGEVEAIKVPIVNLIIDDGTGTIPIVGFRDRAEKITNMSSDEIIGLTEDIDKYKSFSNSAVGSKIEIIGNVGVNTMTGEPQIMVNSIIKVDLKPENKVEQADKKKEVIEDKKIDDSEIGDLEIEEIDLDDDLL